MKKLFKSASTLEELKRVYRNLALKHHPDRGGNVEIMKEINSLYDEYFKKLKDIHKNKNGETYTKTTNETPDEFRNIIDTLIKMDGIHIEIIGSFIWISGNTKPYREQLKQMKFKWHSTKKLWYLAPDDYKRYGKKSYSMDEIRDMYGVQYEADGTSAKHTYNAITTS